VFTFFFVDFFDTAGTLIGVSQFGDFLDEDGDLPDMDKPLMADAVGTTAGAMLGTSTVTTFIESSTGVEEGGRTGLTALAVAGLFVASLAVIPIVAAIPSYASFIALIVVGVMMLQGLVEVDWDDPAGRLRGTHRHRDAVRLLDRRRTGRRHYRVPADQGRGRRVR